MSRKNQLLILTLFLGLVALVFFTWQIYAISHQRPSIFTPTPTSTPIPTPTLDPNRDFSILLLGYAGGNHDGSGLTDSLVLAQIQPHFQKINLISIPRDLWVNMAPSEATPSFYKINYAYAYQGGQLAKSIISTVTGIYPDWYLAVNFSGFSKIIDILGGVDIKINKSFTDKFYPIEASASSTCDKTMEEITALEATLSGEKLDQQFPCRYETLVFNVGTTRLDGISALKYARSRHSLESGGDFNRSLRQKELIQALQKKMLQPSVVTKIPELYKTFQKYLDTDFQFSDLNHHLLRLNEYSQYKIENISLNDKNVLQNSKSSSGQFILIPTHGLENYQGIQEYLLK